MIAVERELSKSRVNIKEEDEEKVKEEEEEPAEKEEKESALMGTSTETVKEEVEEEEEAAGMADTLRPDGEELIGDMVGFVWILGSGLL